MFRSVKDILKIVFPDLSVSGSGVDEAGVRDDGVDGIDVGSGQTDPQVRRHVVPDHRSVLKKMYTTVF